MIDPFNNHRIGMTLYTTKSCIEGHACRIVLHEKEVECDVEFVDLDQQPNPIIEVNPYGESPTLVDRELELYGSHVIAEYLDERLPHPPLMPPDPINRGRTRLMLYRCQRDWLAALRMLDENKQKPSQRMRASISRDLAILASYLPSDNFWFGEEFSLVDCFIAPLLWRLNHYGIALPTHSRSIRAYSKNVFSRPSFRASLSSIERDMFASF